MLYMVTQTHAPENCPAREANPQPLFALQTEGVTLKGFYACPPEHVLYFLLETDSFEALQEFLGPGLTRTTVDIKPVAEITQR